MIKRLSLLNGFAIFAVVANHASHRGFEALLYLNNVSATLQILSDVSFFLLLIVRKLAVFSVPVFLFFSGFFIAFAARGSQTGLSWKVIRQRVITLIIPYVIWSVVIFISNAYFNHDIISLPKYVARLLYGGAIPHYYFVPLLVQLYVLSPFIVELAKKRPAILLISTGAIQLLMMSFPYLGLVVSHPVLDLILKFMSYWSLFPMWIFFFAFGVYAGFHLNDLKAFITRFRWVLLAVFPVFGTLAVLEAYWMMNRTHPNSYFASWTDTPLTLPSVIYALAFMLAFLAFEQVKVPLANFFSQLSSRTYGIYLTHTILIGIAATLLIRLPDVILAIQPLYQPILVTIGLGIPLLLMVALSRSRASKVYRYLFG